MGNTGNFGIDPIPSKFRLDFDDINTDIDTFLYLSFMYHGTVDLLVFGGFLQCFEAI